LLYYPSIERKVVYLCVDFLNPQNRPRQQLVGLSAELPCFPIRHIPLLSIVYSKSLAPHGTDLPLANHSVNQSSPLFDHY
jgi:hypothetical protein